MKDLCSNIYDLVDELEEEATEVYSGDWINIYFRKNGSSVTDYAEVFPNEEEALARNKEADHWVACSPSGYMTFEPTEHIIIYTDYSHAIAIPYKENKNNEQ